MFDPPSAKRARIFISYKHKVEPDQSVVDQVVKTLEPHHTVFIDKKILPGLEWGKWIQDRISESDFLIVFLTAQSVGSEMVRAEIQLAHELAQKQDGRPRIFPVRLAYYDKFIYPLSAYLDHIQWAEWNSDADTPRLIDQLQQVIAQQAATFEPSPARAYQPQAAQSTEPPAPTPSAQPRKLDPTRLDSPEGTIDPQSAFYVVRSSDEVALNAIQRQGGIITIKGPRQMGKSSLLIRTLEKAVEIGKRVVFLDYQLIERDTLTDADKFYRRFCDWVTDELEMENRVDEFWDSPLGNNQRCTRYFSRYLLKELNQPLALAMDEVENLFDTSFRSDFFGMLRSWYNAGKNFATPIWKQLDLVLVTSTEPYQLIENLNQSPFNVGEVINLEDFTAAQVADLNGRHGSPLSNDEEQRLMRLLNGHPYLTQRLCMAMADVGHLRWTEADVDRVIADTFLGAMSEQDNNLQFVRDMLTKRAPDVEGALTTYGEIRAGNPAPDEERSLVKSHLKLSGVVRREGAELQTRNRIYETVFDEQWVKAHLPVNWRKRARYAAAALLAAFLIFSPALLIYAWKNNQLDSKNKELEKALAEARQARDEAVEARESEAAQRKTAESNATEAERQSNRAVASAAEAERLRRAAQANATEAQQQRSEAEQQRNIAQSRELAANSILLASVDPDLSLSLVNEAMRRARTSQAEDAFRQFMLERPMINILRGHSRSVSSASYSPDGKFIVTASADRTARIYPRVTFMPFDELMELARKFSPRELTPAERERFLHEPQGKQEKPK